MDALEETRKQCRDSITCIALSESFIVVSLAISLSINILMHVTCVITARTFYGVSAIYLSVSIIFLFSRIVCPPVLYIRLSRRGYPFIVAYESLFHVRVYPFSRNKSTVSRSSQATAWRAEWRGLFARPWVPKDLQDLAMLIKLSLTPLNRQTSVAVNTKTLSSYTFNYEWCGFSVARCHLIPFVP